VTILDLLSEKELPEGFSYPQEFYRLIENGLTSIEPWYMLDGSQLREKMRGLGERFPARILIPFACRQDNDDVACWQSGMGDAVFIVHDFASPGWEQRGQLNNLYDWLRRAIDDFIEFDY
jgi:hypothetical protein